MEEIKLPDFDKLKDTVIDEIMVRVVERTPVDTGNAKKGWYKDSEGVHNDVPYVDILENGWSDQAPNGFVRVSLEEIPRVIEDFIKKETK